MREQSVRVHYTIKANCLDWQQWITELRTSAQAVSTLRITTSESVFVNLSYKAAISEYVKVTGYNTGPSQ
jgi:hypothetical protein